MSNISAISIREQVIFFFQGDDNEDDDSNDDDDVRFVLDQQAKLDFYSTNLMLQQFTRKHA